MKKNYFLLLCSVLLSVSFFGTACSDDNSEVDQPVVEAPTFPELVTKTATAGEVINLSFDANYAWVASISEETYTYFQLLTGEGDNATTTKTVSGAAGANTIKVKVAEDVVYDNAPVGEVSLTMNGETKVIAKISYPVTERLVSIYAPQINDWGAFKNGTYGGELLYAYEETAMASDAFIQMAWGVERGNTEGADTFYAPVLVETNFAYTIAGPEWMVAATAGNIGVQEHVIKADLANLPADTAVQAIDILAAGTETVVASFNVEVTGYNNFIVVEGFSAESEYAADGTAQGYSAVEGYITAADTYVAVICDATGAEADWVTINATSSDDTSVIKTYTVDATVAENTGSTRVANVFFFAKNTVPADYATLFDEEGNVKEEYSANFATTITQYPTPATIEGTEVDSEAATFNEVGADFANSWFFDDLHLAIGSKYELHYWGQWATSADAYTYFTASRPIESLTCYYYNDMGSLVEVSEENPWVSASTFGKDDEEKTKFRVYCTSLNGIPASAQNFQNGDYEAVVVVEHTDGSYSAIYFHISGKSEADEAGVAFENEQYAGWAGASLVELQAGDELYEAYFAEFSSTAMPAKFYHLTYQYPLDASMYSMVRLTGIGSDLYANPICDWAYYNQMSQVVVMEAAGAEAETPGAICFMNGMGINQIVILCTLVNGDGSEEGGDEGDDEPATIDWDYVCGAYKVDEWSSPYWNKDAQQRYSKLGYGFWYNYVKLASECKDGNDPANPKDGQRYGLIYSWNNHIFFDISSTEIDPATWEPKSGTGCYQIVNMIDRSKDTDHIENNYSYYDKNEEAFYISFTLTSGGKVYRHDGKMHSRGSVDIKEP